MSRIWRCRSPRTFFGLNHDYAEAVYEQMFALVFHGKISLIEAYNLPVGLRLWFIKRLQRHFEDEKEAREGTRKARKHHR